MDESEEYLESITQMAVIPGNQCIANPPGKGIFICFSGRRGDQVFPFVPDFGLSATQKEVTTLWAV
jgi:hypothetical protein